MRVQRYQLAMARSVVLLALVSTIFVACDSPARDRESESSHYDVAPAPSVFERVFGSSTEAEDRPGEAALPTWRIGEAPAVSLTGAEVNGDTVFFHRVSGGIFTRDEGFVVGIGGDPSTQNALLFFDADGAFRSIAGRTGSGPGEFTSVGPIFGYGEGLVVLDIRLRRATWFTTEGDFVGTTSLQEDEFRGWMVGAFADGTIVTTHSSNDAEHGLRRYALRSLDGEFLKHLEGPSEPPSQDVLRIEGISMRASGAQTVFSQIGAGNCFPKTMSVVLANEVIVVEPETGVVYSLDREGLRSIVHEQERRAPVTQMMVDGLRASIEGGIEQVRQPPLSADSPKEVTGAMERLGAAGDPMPSAWGAVLRDASGDHVWLRPANCYERPTAERWEVVAIDTGVVAEVIVPSDMRMLAVSDRLVLAHTRDELGVEHVGVYPIEK